MSGRNDDCLPWHELHLIARCNHRYLSLQPDQASGTIKRDVSLLHRPQIEPVNDKILLLDQPRKPIHRVRSDLPGIRLRLDHL